MSRWTRPSDVPWRSRASCAAWRPRAASAIARATTLGGARDVLVRRGEHHRDVAALEVIVPALLGILERQRGVDDLGVLRRGGTRIEPQAEVAELHARARQGPRALEDIAQLANVARPRVVTHALEVAAVDRAGQRSRAAQCPRARVGLVGPEREVPRPPPV